MSAVIYDTVNTHIIKRYKTLAAAKAALTRASNTGSMRYMASFGYGRMGADRIENLCACTMDYFDDRVDYMVEVKNLMSGKTIKIRRSAQGGCTDPSTERYWSM
jgi:hypothetical protein